MPSTAPAHYQATTRVILRYATVMTVVGLLSGIAFQESSKKVLHAEIPPGLHLHATLHLALVHGHFFVAAVLLPVALAGMLFLARQAGGAELRPRTLRWLTWGFLPFLTLTLALMLYKGYHVLLSIRWGGTDLDAVHRGLFGGSLGARFLVYAFAHVGMAVTLVVFLWGLWRSLRARPADAAQV